MRIRYFQDLLPQRAHAGVELCLQSALTLFGLLITWYSVGLVAKNHDLTATSLPISMAWMYVPMVAAGIATAIQGGAELVQAFDRLRSRGVPSASEPR